MDNLNDVKDAMSVKRVAKKKDTSKGITPTNIVEEPPTVEKTVDKTVDETVDETLDNREQTGFQGCNTCRNFGSFPSWRPCCNCRHNPNNQQSYYQR